jgi:hypothetical protein
MINNQRFRLRYKTLHRVRRYKGLDVYVWWGVIGRVDDADLINRYKMASSLSGAIQEP